MNLPTDKKKWLAQYRETSDALARIRAQELYALTDQRAREILNSLGTAGIPWRERRDYSGLVEQQRPFHRKRKP